MHLCLTKDVSLFWILGYWKAQCLIQWINISSSLTSHQHWWERVNNTLIESHLSNTSGSRWARTRIACLVDRDSNNCHISPPPTKYKTEFQYYLKEEIMHLEQPLLSIIHHRNRTHRISMRLFSLNMLKQLQILNYLCLLSLKLHTHLY